MGCQTWRTGLHLRPLHDPGEELLVLGPDHGGGVPPAEGHAARPRPRPRLPPQHHQLQLRAQLQAGALRGEDLDPDNVSYPVTWLSWPIQAVSINTRRRTRSDGLNMPCPTTANVGEISAILGRGEIVKLQHTIWTSGKIYGC